MMVAINFTLPGAPEMIRSGRKITTFRPYKDGTKFEQITKANNLELYWKQRTKECYKIADAELVKIKKLPHLFVIINYGVDMKTAFNDGFNSKAEMWGFFDKHYTYEQLTDPWYCVTFRVKGDADACQP